MDYVDVLGSVNPHIIRLSRAWLCLRLYLSTGTGHPILCSR